MRIDSPGRRSRHRYLPPRVDKAHGHEARFLADPLWPIWDDHIVADRASVAKPFATRRGAGRRSRARTSKPVQRVRRGSLEIVRTRFLVVSGGRATHARSASTMPISPNPSKRAGNSRASSDQNASRWPARETVDIPIKTSGQLQPLALPGNACCPQTHSAEACVWAWMILVSGSSTTVGRVARRGACGQQSFPKIPAIDNSAVARRVPWNRLPKFAKA